MAPKKKGKKKPAAGDWGSDDDVATPDLAAPSSNEVAEEGPKAAQPAKKAKKAKKGKGKAKPGDDWGSDDDLPPSLGAPAPEDDQPEERSARQSGNGRAAAQAFAMLNGSDDGASSGAEDEPAAAKQSTNGVIVAPPTDESDDDDQPVAKAKDKSKKKKKMAFEMPVEEEAEVLSASEDDAEQEAATSAAFAAKRKPKKGKKSGFVMPADDDAEPAGAPVEIEVEAVEAADSGLVVDRVEPLFADGKSKKKKSKSSKADVASAFAALDLGEDAAEDSSEPAVASEEIFAAGPKKKKKGKKADLDSMWAELDAESSAVPDDSPAAEPASEPAQPPAEAKSKRGGKAKKAEEDDIDALLAELDGPKAPEPVADAASGKKKKKKGKGAAAAKEEEDLDALLAEFGAPVPAKPATDAAGASAGAVTAEGPPEDANDAEDADDDDDGEVDEKNMSAAAKKKAKKKAKDKEKKAKEKEAGVKGPKVTAAVRRMQEAQEARLKADSEAAAAEEERFRMEEEARIAEEEAAAKAETQAEERREARAAARALAKKEGRLLTGKAKKEADRLAAMRTQLLARSDTDFLPGADGDEDRPAKKKVVYGKKKGPKKGTQPTPAEEIPAVEPLEATIEATPESSPDAVVALEAAPAVEAVQSDVESEGADWDALDLDEIALPGQKSVKEIAAEKAAAEAAEVAAAEAAAKALADAETARLAAEAIAAEKAAKAEEESEVESEEESEEDSEEESGSDSDSESESESDDSSSYDSDTDEEEAKEERIASARAAREERVKKARLAGSRDELRSPICCILGHVDTGKTKILDNVRRTNVQDGEAGGITQQIGATYVPGENIAQRTASLRKDGQEFELKVPGLLIIDTPGHESFTNLRSRGSSLCDIAILVVDIMHGLEQQTIESINLLKQRKTPFIIALNKVDRMFDWKAVKDAPIRDSMAQQKDYVRLEFDKRLQQSTLNLNEQGLNVALYWANPDPRKYVNIVPTSAITGEGIPDLLQLLVTLTQTRLGDRLIAINELQCTVLEVKVVEGLGTTMDVVLINGVLHENDTVVVCGLGGPIVTPIRSLLTPHPMKELRVKGSYLHHKEVKAAQGIKIAAQGLESAVAGTQMLVVQPGDNLDLLKEEVMADMQDIFSSVDRGGEGVCVQASTLGSLEALLEFLKSPAVKIPVSGINIGPVAKRDIMRASVMLEKGDRKFACILAFDVTVNKEARELAESMGVRIFSADIIYHLFDQFTAYLKQVKEDEQENARLDAVFPCILKIMPTCIFNKKDPIVLGVEVMEGIAKVGTPITIPSQGGIDLGRIASMELNHKAVDIAKKGDSVAMKLEPTNTTEGSRLYGRHFDFKDELVSRITRKSIDLLKEHFRDDLSKDDWRLVVKLKSIFEIV